MAVQGGHKILLNAFIDDAKCLLTKTNDTTSKMYSGYFLSILPICVLRVALKIRQWN